MSKILFDFGISQEDPLTEQFLFNIQPSDQILSVASGGEVALSLMSLNDNIRITAVDVSEQQIMLCRLKLLTAIHLNYPQNGQFLGLSKYKGRKRLELYQNIIRSYLSETEIAFWDNNQPFIAKGIVKAGRFEQYLYKLRSVAQLFIGKGNLRRLIASKTLEEQKQVFDNHIASRISLQLLFKVAFHPKVYKNRGLQEQALIHAGKTTGERFFGKLQNFCTSSLAANNYFLQYFMTGNCISERSLPPYLQSENKSRLIKNFTTDRQKIDLAKREAI